MALWPAFLGQNIIAHDERLGDGTAVAAHVRGSLRYLAVPDQCVCLWVKDAQDGIEARTRHRTGYFTDHARLVDAAVEYSGSSAGVYVTLNPVVLSRLDPAVLKRGKNCLTPFVRPPKEGIMQCRRLLLVDVDPCREGTVAATDAEKELAANRAEKVRAWLGNRGWPLPLIMDSGNGTCLLYRIEIPATDQGLVHRILLALSDKFSDDGAKIDTSVAPAKQLMRLPGTMNCKGASTPDRPHRHSGLPFGLLLLMFSPLLAGKVRRVAACCPGEH